MGKLYIGVMSGTSLDGIDISLCEIKNESIELLYANEYNFDENLKKDILESINGSTTLKTIGKLDTRLGVLFSRAINTFLIKNKIDKKTISAIGLHGQTLWHEPNSKTPFSMQLGNASLVTVETGIKVICDFRQKDIALGGQGAPFAPAFHQFLFSRLKENIAVLNIGGMANLSILGKNLLGYDTGCGNVLLDYWVSKNENKSYDEDGLWAKSGKVNQELLDDFLNEKYFFKAPPKSTGRELFNGKWLEEKLFKYNYISKQDVQATLLALTIKSIVQEIKKHTLEMLIVCGGGVKNKELMRGLKEDLWEIEVCSSDECGVSSSYMEAMAFAWLAYKRDNKEVVDIKSVTGAKENSILGCIYE